MAVESSTRSEAREERSVGARVRMARKVKGWSLARLSSATEIPQSTLSKFETDSLSLPLDRVFRLSDALGLSISDLSGETKVQTGGQPGRRSIMRGYLGKSASSANYERSWLFSDLRQKRMFPVVQKLLARSLKDFGPLVHHEGEEFIIVIKGNVTAGDVKVFGKVEGKIIGERCELKAKSRLDGDIKAKMFSMEEGAQLSGRTEIG